MKIILKYFFTVSNYNYSQFLEVIDCMSSESFKANISNGSPNQTQITPNNRGGNRYESNFSDTETSQDQHNKYQYKRNYQQNQSRNQGYRQNQFVRNTPQPNRKKNRRQFNQNRYSTPRNRNPKDRRQDEREKLDKVKNNPYTDGEKLKQKLQRSNLQDNKQQISQEVQYQANDIIQEVQRLEYQGQTLQNVQRVFKEICGGHIIFKDLFPQAQSQVGEELLKNGLFHDMWSKVALRSSGIQKHSFIQVYYCRYMTKVKRGLSNFQTVFNPIPGQDGQFDPQTTFKRYRSNLQQNTNSNTRMDCMIVFQQVKAELKTDEIEESLCKKVLRNIDDWRVKTANDELSLKSYNLNIDQHFDTDEKQDYERWQIKEEQQRKQAAIRRINQERTRQKSPLSNRFRMMHECQTNQRRLQVEMAYKYYFLNDLQIVKIQQTVFSQKQQIIVLKAYTLDFCPQMGQIKIQPKVRSLVAAYKFSGLIELIRLEKTHGKFDGLIVYPQSFDIQKYLLNSKEITLINDEYLKKLKEQVEQNQGY